MAGWGIFEENCFVYRRLFLPFFIVGSISGLFLNISSEWVLFLLVLDSLLMVVSIMVRLFLFSPKFRRAFGFLDAAVAVMILLAGLINSQRNTSSKKFSFRDSDIVEEIESFVDSSIDTLLSDPSLVRNRGLLKALVLGNKSELDSSIKSDFRRSGASHILALSGMHIGVIYSAILLLLFPFNITVRLKRVKLPLVLAVMVLYVVVTGLSPSACRAVLMIGMNLWARESGRSGYIETPLLLSAAILLIIDPHAAESLSFQLSFAAMAGIVFIFPTLGSAFDNLFHDTGEVGKEFTNQESLKLFTRVRLHRINPFLALVLWLARVVYQLCAISISCQIATAPLVLYYFGSLPQQFLITNIVASPLVSLIIYSFLIFLLVNSISYFASLLLWGGATCNGGMELLEPLLHLLQHITGELLSLLISVMEWLAV